MLKRHSINYAVISLALDLLLTLFAFWLAVRIRETGLLPFARPGLFMADFPARLYLVVTVIWTGVFVTASVYDPDKIYRAVDEFLSITLSISLAALIFAALLYMTDRDLSRALFVLFVSLDAALLLGWRSIARLLWRQTQIFRRRPVLILGTGELALRLAEALDAYGGERLKLAGFLQENEAGTVPASAVLGRLDQLASVVAQHRIEELVVALPPDAHPRINEIISLTHALPVTVRIVPDYFSLALYRASVEDFGGIPLISLHDPALNSVQRFLKRTLDLVTAGITLPLLMPLFGLVALLIKLDSEGPVFFRQKRVGENGHLFEMVKFRTMQTDAEKNQEQVNQLNGEGELIHKRPDDPRITRIGRFLRRTSLDEMPQLINVLKGEMSLVGPRPEMPWLVAHYAPWQRKRFAVPQGMTGWWQVNGRSDKPMHLHTDEDLFYIRNYSIWLDLYIILKTPLVVLRGKGAW